MRIDGDGSSARATHLALRFLALKDRTEREIRAYLEKKGTAPQDVQFALERLRGWGYLDDERVALGWTKSRIERAQWGPARLARDLATRGVGEEVIDRVLHAAMEDVSEEELARRATERYLQSHPGSHGRGGIRRLAGYLGRRGYGGEVIRRILDERRETLREVQIEDDPNTVNARRA